MVARFNYGVLLLRLGDGGGAETQMRTLIEQDASNARPYLLLGQVLLDRPGHLAEVERLALAGLERARDNDLKALGYFLLADVYSREGRRNEFHDALRKGQHYRAQIRG
jgi:predicted Zn-dependent protease